MSARVAFTGWQGIQDDGSMSAKPLGPPKPWRCVDGYESHEWTLAIEEGRLVLHADCDLCCSGIADWHADDEMLFQMEPIAVRMAVEHEPGNPPYGIDPFVWIDLTPAVDSNTVTEGAKS